MAKGEFAATIRDWADKIEGAKKAILQQSIQEVVSRMQVSVSDGGRMRVDTGFLRASLMASTAVPPVIDPGKSPPAGAQPNSYAYEQGTVDAVILGMEPGETIYIGYTASYALAREYGARGQEPDAFVRTAAEQWPQIVSEKEAELKSRLGL